jgi:hypothetical protein
MFDSEPAQPLQLLNSDERSMDTGGSGGLLGCSVIAFKPELGFDFLFHTGYEVTVPLKELAGASNRLNIVMRVQAERRKDQPVYFSQNFHVPGISEYSTGFTVLGGSFRVSEGKYHVDWLMRDMAGRICARFWNMDVKAERRDTQLASELPKDVIQPVESTAFDEQSPVFRQTFGRSLSVKIIINFAPQSLDATTLGDRDLLGLATILRKIANEKRIGRFSIVACSVRAQQVFYRQKSVLDIDLRSMGEALKRLDLGKVDSNRLAMKYGETEFLTRLISEEMQDDPTDGLIFVSPKYPLQINISRDVIETFKHTDQPIFYLNYSLDPSYYPWRDAIGRIVKQLHGFEYTIARPRDLFNAWSDVMSHILSSRQMAQGLGAER